GLSCVRLDPGLGQARAGGGRRAGRSGGRLETALGGWRRPWAAGGGTGRLEAALGGGRRYRAAGGGTGEGEGRFAPGFTY
ncbi:MAG: hypothetical protein LBQ12_03690, partial [Deltaproteobacteria bacterium]|nr:hypothetical protein [Deltaproteobacteria bacterium]